MHGKVTNDELDMVSTNNRYSVPLSNAKLAREPSGSKVGALVNVTIGIRFFFGDDEGFRRILLPNSNT